MDKLTLAADFPTVTEGEWIDQAEKTIKTGGIDQLVFRTLDDIAIQPIYATPSAAFPSLVSPSNKGDAPWKIVQRTDIPDLAAANEQILDDLLNGATAISLVLPGAVTAGSFGVLAGSVSDLKRLMKNVELDLVALRLDGGPGARQMADMLLQVYQDRNMDLSRCDLSFCLDPVANFALAGSTAGKKKIGRHMASFLARSREAGHRGVVFSGDGRIYHEAGASQAQELGFAIASVVQHLHLLATGHTDLTNIWPQLGLVLSADTDQFLTIAKLRAAHLVWQRLQEAMEVEPVKLQLDVETSRRMMSQLDPHVNMLRTTTATFAAGIGGASSIAILPFSSAIGLPDGFARRIARNAHIVLQEESGVGLVGDAAAGSGYVEALTGQIAEKAWQIMQKVEAKGGMFEALLNGHVQKSIASNAVKTSTAIESGEHVLVGVNQFTTEERTSVKTLDFEPVSALETAKTKDFTCDRLEPARLSEPFEKLANRD